jgi:pilus assembly protein Flp/PilA
MRWKEKIAAIWHDQTGTSTVEYGLILAVVFLAMVGAAEAFGQTFIALWNRTSGDLTTSIGA